MNASPKHWETHKFTDLLKTLKMVARDKFFMTGDQMTGRKRGWPMGGSLSEPGCACDVNMSLHKNRHTRVLFAQNEQPRRDLDDNFSRVKNLMRGVMHVDDSMILSKSLCDN